MAVSFSAPVVNDLSTYNAGGNHPQSHGNFLTHLFPTIGGIAGGAGGGALGGALAGSAVLPGIGTAVGGLLGALLGGGAGGAAGKLAENKVEHQSLGHDVLRQGIEQGALSAGPVRILKGLGIAGKAATGGAGSLLDALGQGGAVDAKLAAPGLLAKAQGTVASKTNSTADNLAQRGLKINDSNWLTKFKNESGQEAGQFARQFNIPQNGLEHTQANVLQPGYAAHAAAVDAVGSIPKADVLKSIQAQVAKKASSKVPASQEFAKKVMENAKGVLDNFGNSIPATELNAVKSEIAGQVNHAATDTASLTNNQMLNRVSSGFRQAINTAADKKGIGVDPGLAALGFKSKTVGDLGQEVRSLQNLLEKADIKSRVGTGSNPLDLPAIIAGSGVGGPAGLAAAGAVKAINSTAGKQTIAKGIDALAQKADASAAKSTVANPFGLKSIATRSAPVGLLGALTGTAGNQLSQTNQTNTQTTINPMANNIDTTSQTQPNQSSNSPFDPANIEANIEKMVAGGATMKDISAYVSLASSINSLQASAAKSGAPQTIKPTGQQYGLATGGLNALQQLSQLIQQDPSVIEKNATPGQGLPLVGSLVTNAAGAGNYHPLADSILQSLIHLQTGATATPEEIKAARGQLPAPGDSAEVQQRKLNNLAAMFAPYVQGGTLGSALGAQ